MAENDIIVAKEGASGTLSEIALAPSDIGAANASHTHTAADIDSGASESGTFLQSNGSGGAGWNNVSYADLEDVPISFTPASHASSHAAAGSDPVFNQNLNTTDSVSFGSVTAESFLVYNATDGFSVELDTSGGLGDDRTLSLPDASGTIAITADIPDPSSATPQALGTAAAGSSTDYSRADHVHPLAGFPIEYVIACSDETSDLTTGTAKVTFRAPVAFLLTGVAASVNTAPTGSTLILDINNGANSALSTKLSIDASEKTSATAATAAVIDTTYDDFAADAEITIDIDQIGSTIAGKGLKVVLKGTRA